LRGQTNDRCDRRAPRNSEPGNISERNCYPACDGAAASRLARITSAAYQLALAAYRPEQLDNVARPNLAGDSEIAAFMDRIEVFPDKALEQLYPDRWPALVEVLLKNGHVVANFVLDARGDPPRSCDLDVRAKFHRLADPVVGNTVADELEQVCLAAIEDDDALTKLCTKFNS
jgi:2-methylcitrate dehydratase PrpD